MLNTIREREAAMLGAKSLAKESLAKLEGLERRCLLSAGAVDPYFGTNGATTVATISSSVVKGNLPLTLTVAPDGSIFGAYYRFAPSPLEAGLYSLTLHVRKFTRDGVPDRRFIGSGAGEVLVPGFNTFSNTSPGDVNEQRVLYPTSDGSLFVASDSGLYKYRFNGTLDKSFAGGRIGLGYKIKDLGVRPDGGVMILRGADAPNSSYDLIYGFTADGHFDPGFGDDGTFDVPIGNVSLPNQTFTKTHGDAIVTAPDGSAYGVGTFQVHQLIEGGDGFMIDNFVNGLLIAHFKSDGSLDASYGDGGVLRVGSTESDSSPSDTSPIDQRINNSVLNVTDASLDATGGLKLLTSGPGGQVLLHITADGKVVHDPAPPLVHETFAGSNLLFLNDDTTIAPRVYSDADGTFTVVRLNSLGVRDKSFAAPTFKGLNLATPTIALEQDGAPLLLHAETLANGSIEIVLHRLWRSAQPVAEASAAAIVSPTTLPALITVTYRDAGKIDLSSLDNRDLRITGPNGFVAYAKFDRVLQSNSSGGLIAARYKLSAPGPSWDAKDNGAYVVRLRASEVLDASHNAADARAVATITVNIPPAMIPQSRPSFDSATFSNTKIDFKDPLDALATI